MSHPNRNHEQVIRTDILEIIKAATDESFAMEDVAYDAKPDEGKLTAHLLDERGIPHSSYGIILMVVPLPSKVEGSL